MLNTDGSIWLHDISWLLIWIAYMVTPFIISRKLTYLSKLCIIFIGFCGLTHLLTYNYYVKIISAIISWIAVFILWKILPPNEHEIKTKELENSLKLLKQKEEERITFIAVLAHELRNPLAPIRTTIHIIKEKYRHLLDHGFLEMESMIERQLNHLNRMIDDLLDVARITHNKVKLCVEPIKVITVLDGVFAVLEGHNLYNKHKFTVECDPNIYITADITRLEQIITNLLHNAVKYTDEGKEISIVVKEVNDKVSIKIKDSGCGIPDHVLPNIFEMFYQSDHSLERTSGGLGIGLTIVKKLVDLHEGSIEIESKVNIGTTFTLFFQSSGQIIYNRKILIVEDAENIFRNLLKIDNCEARICNDGNSAIVTANIFDPDVVILNVGSNGFEVAKNLRASTITERAKIIVIGQEEKDIALAEKSGVNKYLVKPIDPVALRSTVLSLI